MRTTRSDIRKIKEQIYRTHLCNNFSRRKTEEKKVEQFTSNQILRLLTQKFRLTIDLICSY